MQNDEEKTGYTYADAGVSIDEGNALVDRIKPLAKRTERPGANVSLGGFGAFFDPKAAGYSDPLLVAATDGVGTKLRLAIDSGDHKTVGIDLVAMCVNDLIVQGAEPLFFLDYFASGKLETGVAADVVEGIAEGCRIAGCALVGGETAEMPGMYGAGDYDLAGFCVGAVERGEALTGAGVEPGDVILGVASDGFHSNGFSLVRRIVADKGHDLDAAAPYGGDYTLGASLRRPTRIYVKSLLPAVRAGRVKALAHITGGGILENVPRVLEKGLRAEIDANGWTLQPEFGWIRDEGRMNISELLRTFNCGIGMVVIASPDNAAVVAAQLQEAGETVHTIGRIVEGQRGVTVSGARTVWDIDEDWSAAYDA